MYITIYIYTILLYIKYIKHFIYIYNKFFNVNYICIYKKLFWNNSNLFAKGYCDLRFD